MMKYSIDEIIHKLLREYKLELTYYGRKYESRLFGFDFAQSIIPDITMDHINVVPKYNKFEIIALQLMIELYWKLHDSPTLGTKVGDRIIRRGIRKFSYATFGMQKKFSEYDTFPNLEYESGVIDGKERYTDVLKTIKDEAKANKLDPNKGFKNSIYYNIFKEDDLDEKYISKILEKIIELKQKEEKFWKEASENQLKDPVWLRTNLADQHRKFISAFKKEFSNPLFKALFYAIESSFFNIWHLIFMEIFYRLDAKYNLSKVDQKVYFKTYLRQPYLENHIPIFEPILWEFNNSLGKKEKSELIYCLFFCESESELASLTLKYKSKFEDFLIMYPLYVEVLRIDENTPISRIQSRNSKIENDEFYTDLYTLDVRKEKNDKFANKKTNGKIDEKWLCVTQVQIEKIIDISLMRNIIDTKLTPAQKKVIDLFLQDHMQNEIADILGITQSAVSQRFRLAIKRIRKFLY